MLYPQVFVTATKEGLEYRGNLLLQILAGFSTLVINYFLWSTIFRHSGPEMWDGYTFLSIFTYFVATNLCGRFCDTIYLETGVSEAIRTGEITQYIVRPINHQLYVLADFLGRKVSYLSLALLPHVAIVLWVGAYIGLALDVSAIPAYLVATLLGAAISFAFGYILSVTAFWFADVSAFFVAKMLAMVFLSGSMIPLDLLPPAVASVFSFLPFRYFAFVPGQVLLGRIAGDQLTVELVRGVCWLVGLGALGQLLWQRGTRRHVGAGG